MPSPGYSQVCSFYLQPHDEKPIPGFDPGQFLTFQLNIPAQPKAVVRCYSLSDAPRPDMYRVSIKRVPPPRDNPDAPPGLSSNHFHDNVKVGDILDVKEPSGRFFLDMSKLPDAVRRPYEMRGQGGTARLDPFASFDGLIFVPMLEKTWTSDLARQKFQSLQQKSH